MISQTPFEIRILGGFEDASLSYSGINTHNDTVVGGWDEVKQA